MRNQRVMPSCNDPLSRIAFDLTPRHDDDTRSFIFPLLTISSEPWEKDRKLSTEIETESMHKFSSSTLLMEAPQIHYKMRKPEHSREKSDRSDTSGYLNFSDTQNENEGVFITNHHRSSIMSAEDLALGSLRDNTCSPELHVLSIGSDTAEDADTMQQHTLSSRSETPERELSHTIVQASNPAFELNPDIFTPDEGVKYSVIGKNHLRNSPSPSAKNDHREEDSGFPASDSGCPLSEDCNSEKGSSSFLAEHEESASNLAHSSECRSTVEDSGFPLDDSSLPLFPGEKHAHAVAAGTMEDSGCPMLKETDSQPQGIQTV